MKELTVQETKDVNGGAVFLLPLLFAETTITAGGVASALGIGAGLGAIAGGLIAVFSD